MTNPPKPSDARGIALCARMTGRAYIRSMTDNLMRAANGHNASADPEAFWAGVMEGVAIVASNALGAEAGVILACDAAENFGDYAQALRVRRAAAAARAAPRRLQPPPQAEGEDHAPP